MRLMIITSLTAAVLALGLFQPTAQAKSDCRKDDLCNWIRHPRPVVKKPITCIKLGFGQWHRGPVAIRIDYSDGRQSVFRSDIYEEEGVYCRGESIWRGGTVCVCNYENFAYLDAEQIADGIRRYHTGDPKQGWHVTLKGSAYAVAHGAKRAEVPCAALPVTAAR